MTKLAPRIPLRQLMGDALPARPRRRTVAGVAAMLALVTIVALFHGSTLRPGHFWSGIDDFTAYLGHGRNLLDGRAYADIDTVHDPDLPEVHLRTAFPPVFPTVLAVVERLSTADGPAALGGLDLIALKRISVACFCVVLLLLWAGLRRQLSPWVLAGVMAATAFSPYLFASRELVRSEMLFLVFVFAWMGMVEHGDRRRLRSAVLVGLLAYLAYGTRTAGAVLLPTLVAHELLHRRCLTRWTTVALGVTVAGIALQKGLLSSVESGYVANALQSFHFGTILENAEQFRWNMDRIWHNGFSRPFQVVLLTGLAALAAVGFVTRLGRRSPYELFAVLYMGMLLVLPTESAWMRYLIPVLPVFFVCVFTGAERVAALVAPRPGRWIRWALVGGVASSYVGAYAQLDDGPLLDGPTEYEAAQALEWVRHKTAPDDVVVFRKPRSLTIATGRRASVYPQRHLYGELPHAELWRHLEAIDAGCLLLKHTPRREVGPYNTLDFSDADFIESFVRHYPRRLVPVFLNGDFTAYEVRDPPEV